jgi:hypothetical protein
VWYERVPRKTPELSGTRWSANSVGRVCAAGLLFVALASVPVFSTNLPPLVDYPNHLARFWIIATGDNAFYSVHWAPLPNLAGDLIVPPLARIMPLEFAGKLFLVAIFALMLGGAIWLNRVATGAWRLWPLLAAAFLYNRTFLWGFINYLFGLGIALCGAALWLQLETARTWVRILASSLVALLCFFCHIAAFGVYALVILGLEMRPAMNELGARLWLALCRRFALAVAQFAGPAVLVIGWWHFTEGGIGYSRIWRKADLLFSVFDNYSRPFDIACFALLLILFAVLAWRRRLAMSPRLGPAVGLVFAAYLLLPSQMLSGSGADHRIAVALFVLLAASTAPRFSSRRSANMMGAVVLVALVSRFAIIEAVWLSADRIYTADLAGLDSLPLGSKLAVAFPSDAVNASAIPALHLPTLAVARRAAFVPTLFAYPAQQPIVVKPSYERLAVATPPTLLWSAFVAGDIEAQHRAWPALAGWDAIAFVDRYPFRVPAQPCLRPLVTEPNFQVFSLLKGMNCGAG